MTDREIMLESEIAELRNELTTAYMVGYRDGCALAKYIPKAVLDECVAVLDHGEVKHPGGEWKKVLPHIHMLAAEGHINQLSIEGREREEESGCYHLAHAIVRYMFALSLWLSAKSKEHRHIDTEAREI